jgi:uncharacterized SAM-binding protein YcdF (DUF218 family)
MTWSDLSWLKSLVLPPGSLLLLLAAGLAWRGRAGRVLVVCAALALAVLSLPFTARGLADLLESDIAPVDAAGPEAQAIVVLSGDYRGFAPEYGEASVGAATLVRLHHAAWLQRRTGLPVLVSGGGIPPEFHPTLGETMRIALERDFHVPVRWVEGTSRNTFENALESRRILARDGIDRIRLVTHAHHMARAVRAFRAAGFVVIPAPTGGQGPWRSISASDLLPDARAFERACAALHEILGLAWYELVVRWRGVTAPNPLASHPDYPLKRGSPLT